MDSRNMIDCAYSVYHTIIVYNRQDAKTLAVKELVSREIHVPALMHPSHFTPVQVVEQPSGYYEDVLS
jgi:hypothetical protein